VKNELHYSLGKSGGWHCELELDVDANVNFIVKHPVPANFRALAANDNGSGKSFSSETANGEKAGVVEI